MLLELSNDDFEINKKIILVTRSKTNTKQFSIFDRFITVVKMGPYKCCIERMLRKTAYSFLMTSIPFIDLDISL